MPSLPPAGVEQADGLLLEALRAAPRRYRLPPLPGDARAALAAGTETALAFAIEAARLAQERRAAAPPATRTLFTSSLAALICESLERDPGFQAVVLRAQEPQVQEYVHLAAQVPADRRAVHSATDAVAHPGKMRDRLAGATREGLSQLHALAKAGAWAELRTAIGHLLAHVENEESLSASLEALRASPALQRLIRSRALQSTAPVRRYQALCEQRGPAAGSQLAAEQGRTSAHAGERAEHEAARALLAVAQLLDRSTQGAAGYRVVRSLRPPGGFPGAQHKAKDEWDAAIVRTAVGGGGVDIVLLAEVKAAAAAATADAARMHRGLQRLAQAGAGRTWAFASAQGPVEVTGESLRRLQPPLRSLPPQVIYCCSAPAELAPPLLGSASKAVLLAEPASLDFAQQLMRGASPAPVELGAVWAALATAPRLRSTLHQHPTARAVREAMLHPDDLRTAVADCLARTA